MQFPFIICCVKNVIFISFYWLDYSNSTEPHHFTNRASGTHTQRCYLKVTINLCLCFISFSCLFISFLLFIFLSLPISHPLSLYCQATHPNMRTYYFCTDTAKEMESWMKVMTDAALVHTEPVRRLVLTTGGDGLQWHFRHITEPQILMFKYSIGHFILSEELFLSDHKIAAVKSFFMQGAQKETDRHIHNSV